MCLWVAANINEALPTILGSKYFQNSILIIIVLRFHTLSLACVGPNNFSFYDGEKTRSFFIYVRGKTWNRKKILKKDKMCKGQLILKCHFGIFNSSKKQTEKIDLTTMVTQVKLFLFFGRIEDNKKTFRN